MKHMTRRFLFLQGKPSVSSDICWLAIKAGGFFACDYCLSWKNLVFLFATLLGISFSAFSEGPFHVCFLARPLNSLFAFCF